MKTLSVPLMIMTVINNISKFDRSADAEQVHDVGVTWFCKHILLTVPHSEYVRDFLPLEKN